MVPIRINNLTRRVALVEQINVVLPITLEQQRDWVSVIVSTQTGLNVGNMERIAYPMLKELRGTRGKAKAQQTPGKSKKRPTFGLQDEQGCPGSKDLSKRSSERCGANDRILYLQFTGTGVLP